MKFKTAQEALENFEILIPEIEEICPEVGMFASVAFGSVVIQFNSDSHEGDDQKKAAKMIVSQWLKENEVALERDSGKGFRSGGTPDDYFAIDTDYWTTEEIEG
jgi:hypothetical protein